MQPDILDAALRYAELGYKAIPIVPGTKRAAVKWKQFQTEAPTEEIYREWFADQRRSIALLTGDVIVADVDDPSLVGLVRDKCGEPGAVSKTPSGGFHLWYRKRKGVHVGNLVDVKGRDFDLRAEGGYAMVPPSPGYEWLAPGLLSVTDLPVFRASWCRERAPRRVGSLTIDDAAVAVRRARAYLACVEGAVSGQRGHDRAMRAAGILCQKFGLSLEQAFPLFKEWSECSCSPPWSDREIVHKLREAIRLRK